jgi:hypothetical protein
VFISHKTTFFIVTAVKTSNLTSVTMFYYKSAILSETGNCFLIDILDTVRHPDCFRTRRFGNVFENTSSGNTINVGILFISAPSPGEEPQISLEYEALWVPSTSRLWRRDNSVTSNSKYDFKIVTKFF